MEWSASVEGCSRSGTFRSRRGQHSLNSVFASDAPGWMPSMRPFPRTPTAVVPMLAELTSRGELAQETIDALPAYTSKPVSCTSY